MTKTTCPYCGYKGHDSDVDVHSESEHHVDVKVSVENVKVDYRHQVIRVTLCIPKGILVSGSKTLGPPRMTFIYAMGKNMPVRFLATVGAHSYGDDVWLDPMAKKWFDDFNETMYGKHAGQKTEKKCRKCGQALTKNAMGWLICPEGHAEADVNDLEKTLRKRVK